MELYNSAHVQDYDALDARVKSGEFNIVSAQNNVPAAQLYATTKEKIEFQAVNEQHEIFKEARASGISLPAGTDGYGQLLTPGYWSPARWSTFEKYLSDAYRTGHIKYYEAQYNFLVDRMHGGQNGTSTSSDFQGIPDRKLLYIGPPPVILPVHGHVLHAADSSSSPLG